MDGQPAPRPIDQQRTQLATIAGILFVVAAVIVFVLVNQLRSRDSRVVATTGSTAPTVSTVTTPVSTTPAPAPPTSAATTAPATTAAATTQPTTSAVPPAPASNPPSTSVAPPPSAVKPVLFWRNYYLGSWSGDTFKFQTFDDEPPIWLADSSVQLINTGGATYNGTAKDCSGSVLLEPSPPSTSDDSYWFSDGAPFTVTQINDDRGLDAMDAALTDQGLDLALVDSIGAPIAADGSIDRIVWYNSEAGGVVWIALFTAEKGKFTTLEGDPTTPPDYDIGEPSGEFVDLDKDGNLESILGLGDSLALHEWATGDDVWAAGVNSCASD